LLDIQHLSPHVDYFIVCSGSSDRQLKAIVDGVTESVQDRYNYRPRHVEGQPESGWVLLDYIDIVVHVFSATQRAFYQLEDVWKEAPVVLKMQ
jgi:ribosome-associated protein